MSKLVKEKVPTIVKDDPWLQPYTPEINARIRRYQTAKSEIEAVYGDLLAFANAHSYFGINFDQKAKGWFYREWAPAAHQLYLVGDFNDWNRSSHPLERKEGGIWEIFLPAKDYKKRLVHQSKVKVHVVADNGSHDRIPAYIRRVVQEQNSSDYAGQIWEPKEKFNWTDENFSSESNNKSPLIYEAHIGMALEKEGVGTYIEFADQVLPRIKKAGYNVIQLMAIMEHPYYGSFGYHVSNFFSPTSRFGNPEDLKYLINKAHEAGISVIMDIVHSHAVKNFSEGLNNFDGSGNQYFHHGGRGEHSAWDSKLFDYGRWEVKQFLLSNVRYWLEEFHFDGYRFDGITSMLYHHHGDGTSFDHYDRYFTSGVEWDAIVYLQLANEVAKAIRPACISIAEDMSGMPGLCRKPKDGGIGFDFRLGMGLPDMWTKYLRDKRDEDWDIFEMWGTLNNRRYKEKTIAYAESHDQAIVGDKTIAFWLMDKDMYYHMHINDESFVIDRGIALHKMIRLLTISLGGEGYLNFIGNEFGHPEWVDFPRQGNNWSHYYARRQWSLVDNQDLKYKYLDKFDKAMINLIKKYKVLSVSYANQLNMDSANKVMVFEKKGFVFVFNFHPHHSIFDYQFQVHEKGDYQIVLCSDDKQFGGLGRIDTSINYKSFTNNIEKISIYLTSRTALVMKKV